MSTTVRLSIPGWSAATEESSPRLRPHFTNPVPAAVSSGGRPVGELDAHLQWDEEKLLARIPLPALSGHAMHATCTLETRVDDTGSLVQWIDAITVTIDHVDDHVNGGYLGANAPAVPPQRARVLDERRMRDDQQRTPRLPGEGE